MLIYICNTHKEGHAGQRSLLIKNLISYVSPQHLQGDEITLDNQATNFNLNQCLHCTT